jgi:transcriptional regulator GlxA family with amidase domain
LSQRGREETIGYGEAILTSGAEACAVAVSPSHFITFRVPSAALAARVPNIQDHVARPIRRRSATQLLTAYAAMLQNPRALPMPETRRLAVAQIYDLMAQAVRPTEATAEVARDARAARLRPIKADVLENLGSDISIASVAARHRLPVRYVQRLFESERMSFTEYLVEQRLLRAHRMLTDPRHADRQIGLIAFESGFGHLPYFNRAFRARFGDTPTGVRTRACHEGPAA